MAKTAAPQEKKTRGEKDSTTGYAINTKKFKVYEVWKAKGNLEDGLKAALKFLGKHDASMERQSKGSVRAWFREFDRRFKK